MSSTGKVRESVSRQHARKKFKKRAFFAIMNCAEHLNVRLRQVSADFDIFPATCYKEKEQRYISPSKCCRNFKRDVSANCNGSLQKSSCDFRDKSCSKESYFSS